MVNLGRRQDAADAAGVPALEIDGLSLDPQVQFAWVYVSGGWSPCEEEAGGTKVHDEPSVQGYRVVGGAAVDVHVDHSGQVHHRRQETSAAGEARGTGTWSDLP